MLKGVCAKDGLGNDNAEIVILSASSDENPSFSRRFTQNSVPNSLCNATDIRAERNGMSEEKKNQLRILRLPEVREKVGLGTSKIYEMVATGEFPLPRKITGRAVGWIEHEVDEWLLSRPTTAE